MRTFRKTVLYHGRHRMGNSRVKRETAELVDIPPITWYVKEVAWLLDQVIFIKNYERIPLNESLVESIKRDGIISPILVMPSWYPIAGSQRLRACKHVLSTEPDHKLLSQQIRVARFDKEWWNCFYLWPNKEDRDKAVQLYFQTVEIAWKSIHYIHEKDFSGKEMVKFEEEGNELKWRDRDKNVETLLHG